MRAREILRLVVSIVVCFLPSFVAIGASPGEWYAQLTKPPLNPPSWVFGPVWTLLYLLMGISLYLVWSRASRHPGATLAVGVFAVQLVLNALWSPAFFGARSPGLGLIVIVPMVVLIAVTISLFGRISNVAGWLLVPYLAWVSFATYLNAAIWWLNR